MDISILVEFFASAGTPVIFLALLLWSLNRVYLQYKEELHRMEEAAQRRVAQDRAYQSALHAMDAATHKEDSDACRYCGSQMVDDSGHCRSCGAPKPPLRADRARRRTALSDWMTLS